MVRRVEYQSKTSHERWLVSYADFITLLFAFFVVMYSISQINEGKYRVLAAALEGTFGEAQEVSEDVLERAISDLEAQAELSELAEQIDQQLQGLVSVGESKIYGNEEWIDIQLSANVLFESGSAEVNQQAVPIFREVASVFEQVENDIAIIGHTDNIPISNAEFANNWELSSARAVSIVSLLAFQGIAPERLSAIGRGEYEPIADNSTEEGRQQNRRVVLRISRAKSPSASAAVSELVFDDPNELVDENSLADSSENGLNEPLPGVFEQNTLEGDSGDASAEVLASQPSEAVSEPAIKPVKLRSGGLLFTSDPDLPRIDAVETEN